MSPTSFFKNKQSGFTLIEMVTVAAIFTIMTSVVLANLPSFRARTSLELVAQEVSLVIRQAQSFGSVTRAALFGSGSTADFPSYGVYFNLDNDGMAYPSDKQFVFFADRRDSGEGGYRAGQYDHYEGCSQGNVETECREVYNLQGDVSFTKFLLCREADCDTAEMPLNVVFQRPNPEALFIDGQTGNIYEDYSHVKMLMRSARDGLCAQIVIWNTGHIYSELIPSC